MSKYYLVAFKNGEQTVSKAEEAEECLERWVAAAEAGVKSVALLPEDFEFVKA